MMRAALSFAIVSSAAAQFQPPAGTTGGGRTVTVQTYSSPDCATGTESNDPFAPVAPDAEKGHPQTATLAFGVCFKDPRVDNMNDDPHTKFNEHTVYSFLPKYMKLVCNPDGTVSKLTYADKSCLGAEVDDQTVTRNLLDAMVSAEAPGFSLDQLPAGAVTITAPSNRLVAGQCYEEFSIDFSSVDATINGGKPVATSTKYIELGQCSPAIAGLGSITTTDYDNEHCTDTDGASSSGGGAGGDAANRVAVQFGICYMDPDFQDIVDDPATAFDETSIGDYLPAYAKAICNADGTVTMEQYFTPDCTGVEADEGAAVRELYGAYLRSETGHSLSELEAGGATIEFPIPDTIANGDCVVQARISLSAFTGNTDDDEVDATKYEFEGCSAATAMVASVGSRNYDSLNCRDDTLDEDSEQEVDQQFGVCAPWNTLNNLVDDPTTPFDETSAGTYLPEFQKISCNDDGTVSIDYFESYNCEGDEVDMSAALQAYMTASFEANYHVTLDQMESSGAVMQFSTPDKIENNHCYPIIGMDFSSLPGKSAEDKVQLGMKYRVRGCPLPAGDDGTAPATCDDHMVTVLSAQVTQACCPQYDPNCGIPTYCSTACAPVFNNFWDTCNSIEDWTGTDLETFHNKCVTAAGGGGGH